MKFNVTLDEQGTKIFQAIKKHFGVQEDNSVIGLLLSQEYTRLQRKQRTKVFLPNEVYDRVEKAAEARGQTIDEYIDEVTEDLLKQKKEQVAEQKA